MCTFNTYTVHSPEYAYVLLLHINNAGLLLVMEYFFFYNVGKVLVIRGRRVKDLTDFLRRCGGLRNKRLRSDTGGDDDRGYVKPGRRRALAVNKTRMCNFYVKIRKNKQTNKQTKRRRSVTAADTRVGGD